ncbi:MAG TPA: glycosyltransferase, partial [Thiolinea sp.]|nr:glycosyltransferase [Thiolinea sp.]
MNLPVNIICMKWGSKYGANYVNTLYAMIARNISFDFQLTCFTDDATGIDSRVQIRELPALELPQGAPERGWNKLTTLQNHLGGLRGDVLFLDLDVVIVGNIDEFFSYPAKFAIIRDAKLQRRMIGNSSVYRFEVGRYEAVLEKFRQQYAEIQQTFRNEQAYLSHEIQQRGELSFWREAWCPSFKYHCMQPWPLAYFQDAKIPAGAKIIIFHGHPEPHEAIHGITHKWYR